MLLNKSRHCVLLMVVNSFLLYVGYTRISNMDKFSMDSNGNHKANANINDKANGKANADSFVPRCKLFPHFNFTTCYHDPKMDRFVSKALSVGYLFERNEIQVVRNWLRRDEALTLIDIGE